MVALVEKIAHDEAPTTREAVRRETAKPKRLSSATKPPPRRSISSLRFTKNKVERDEVIDALKVIIRELRWAK